MIRILAILFFLLDAAVSTCGQNLVPQIESIKSYGGNADEGISDFNGFQFTIDGFILLANNSNSNTHDVTCNMPTSTKAWLLKTDKQGNIFFSICFGGSLQIDSVASSTEGFTDMVTTKDSGCLAACYTNSANIPSVSIFPYTCADSANGYKNLSLVKFDKNGNVMWSRCYGGGQDDGIYSLASTSDGGYVFLAQVRSTGGDVGIHYGSIFAPNCWLVKIDSAGNFQWKKVLGGTGGDYAEKVKEISPGRYMTSINTGSTDSMLTYVTHYSAFDAWFCIFDSVGNLDWEATVPWYGEVVQASDFINTSDGGLIWAGVALGNGNTNNRCNASNYGDFAIFKMDSSFQIQWCNIQYGSAGSLNSITELSDSVFLACGSSDAVSYNSTCPIDTVQNWQGWMICVNNITGQVLWRRTICGSQGSLLYHSLLDTATGAIYVSGAGSSTDGDLTGVPNYGESDAWIFKLELVNGINSMSGSGDQFIIYPNPASDKINLNIEDADTYRGMQLSIYDALGREVYRTSVDKTQNLVDLQSLAAGVYTVKLESGSSSQVKRFIKQD